MVSVTVHAMGESPGSASIHHACRGLKEMDVNTAQSALNGLDWLSAAFCGVGIWCLSPFMPWGNVQAVLAFIWRAVGCHSIFLSGHLHLTKN